MRTAIMLRYSIFLFLFYALFAFSARSQTIPEGLKAATFAGGCFWCMEPVFNAIEGVKRVTVGFAGGVEQNPSYEDVASGKTSHLEAVNVIYDPQKVSYQTLLNAYWHNIDPFDHEGQFCDKGEQYKAGIFYHSEKQARLAKRSLETLKQEKGWKGITVQIRRFTQFYPAEDYHQGYYRKNPVRYKLYRYACGRDKRLNAIWGEPSE